MNPKSWTDRALGWCFSILIGVIVLSCAVQLIASMLPALIVIIGIAGLLFGTYVVISTYRNRW